MTAVNASAFLFENQDGIRVAASRFCKRWANRQKLQTSLSLNAPAVWKIVRHYAHRVGVERCEPRAATSPQIEPLADRPCLINNGDCSFEGPRGLGPSAARGSAPGVGTGPSAPRVAGGWFRFDGD